LWCDLDTVASSGLPHQVILSTASQESADLIVIGSSKPKVGERIVRPVVKDVLHGARVPVLTVPWLPDAVFGGVGSPT
jgi:nucleotide-binding universal stress UspA family protein